MTYKQILEEFDEKFAWAIWEKADEELFDGYKGIKSFLKQSFIKYLQSEVEFIERKKYTTLGTSGEWCKSENTPNGLAQHFTDEFTAKWHNSILEDQITHITNQIRELEG